MANERGGNRGRMGAELYGAGLEVAAQHLKRVGGGLESAVNNYITSFVGQLRTQCPFGPVGGWREKGVDIGKREIEDVPAGRKRPRAITLLDADGVEVEYPALEPRKDRSRVGVAFLQWPVGGIILPALSHRSFAPPATAHGWQEKAPFPLSVPSARIRAYGVE